LFEHGYRVVNDGFVDVFGLMFLLGLLMLHFEYEIYAAGYKVKNSKIFRCSLQQRLGYKN
jgi:hypothetical protein